jgi:16S rRNA (guanine527-N7)-methyltransferase
VTGTDGSAAAAPPELIEVLEEARAQDLLGAMHLESQIAHALGFAHAFEEARRRPPGNEEGLSAGPPARWMDLGSGGGLPGLVLARYWPASAGVLLDSSARRTAFLSEAVLTLGWQDRVQVLRSRAEDAGRVPGLRGGFQALWARSFGSPPVTAECAAPFLSLGGHLVVSEPPPGPGQHPEPGDGATSRWPREALAQLGLSPLVMVRGRFGYQVLEQVEPCPERFPRRAGMAAKRPLYRVPDR